MRLFSTILASISAVLFAVVLFFWARSYSYYEGLVRYSRSGAHEYIVIRGDGERVAAHTEGRTAGIISAQGSLTLASIIDPRQEEWSWFSWSHPIREQLLPNAMTLMRPTLPSAGFSVGPGKATGVNIGGQFPVELPYWRVTVPYVLLALLAGILPVRWFLNYRLVARREREGRCVYCGHDLRGQTGGNCAACGKPIEA